jgi:hypothetical protein
VIKRSSLLVTAALLVATMAMAGLAGPAFAAPTCPNGEPATFGPKGTKICAEEEEQKNPKKTEIQQETFKGAPPADKSEGVQETSCVMETGQGEKVKEGPCPGGQEPA